MGTYTLIRLDCTLSSDTPRALLAAMAQGLSIPWPEAGESGVVELFSKALFSGGIVLDVQWPEVAAEFRSRDDAGLRMIGSSGVWRLVTLSAMKNGGRVANQLMEAIAPWLVVAQGEPVGEIWPEADIDELPDAKRALLCWVDGAIVRVPIGTARRDDDDAFTLA